MPKRSPLKLRLFAKIALPSSPEACWIWTASRQTAGYGRIGTGVGKGMVLAHRLVFELYNGPLEPRDLVDHRCHNRQCVNPEHLRAVTVKQNGEHRAGPQVNSTTGHRGVYWDGRRGKWYVKVGHNGRSLWGGYFEDLEEATTAARGLRLQLFTHSDHDLIGAK